MIIGNVSSWAIKKWPALAYKLIKKHHEELRMVAIGRLEMKIEYIQISLNNSKTKEKDILKYKKKSIY